MKRTLLLLGRTPLARRLVAALLLIGTAIAVSVLRTGGDPGGIDLAFNLLAALAALVFLHFRWRRREKRALTPRTIRDTFR
ncbi:hypothetical protein Ga0102493_112262 [Erythrobacter litoralis]|uniref:Uncharacterized protein n=1 Tax=Erythrobacter litoralis TaxID=39960 RepID=A0A074N3R6_9SPHN|nr:hypothetical protein [Erythrobacter litoralis]AOL23278.1 hypothetical protein Ga0102493_112262 [Erythrobacter litoralis]KEO92577.1 hypothetical protein EH32_15060 [Erythrobacter litoralis]MEE4337081.1 hypothetical protein [Erythrobacter sp.]